MIYLIIKNSRKVLGIIPLVWILLFYLFVLRAYIHLGKMPLYNMPDPKSFNFYIHHTVVFFGIVLVLFSIIAYPIIFIFDLIFNKKVHKFNILVYLIGSIFFFLQTYFDPYGLNKWFND